MFPVVEGLSNQFTRPNGHHMSFRPPRNTPNSFSLLRRQVLANRGLAISLRAGMDLIFIDCKLAVRCLRLGIRTEIVRCEAWRRRVEQQGAGENGAMRRSLGE